VNDEELHAERLAGIARRFDELAGPHEEVRVRRRDVHEVRRVRDHRPKPRVEARGAEIAGALRVGTGRRPRARVRDEELKDLRAHGAGLGHGAAEAAARVRADPHARYRSTVSPPPTVVPAVGT
jgi:hypothetical protein